jgi:hypothetical protein
MRPHVGAAFAARIADELRLYVGQPDVICPSIGRHRDRVRASVVGAIDQDPSGRLTNEAPAPIAPEAEPAKGAGSLL